ncbi:MAG: glycosyltransferase [Pseudomonadota bacterium]
MTAAGCDVAVYLYEPGDGGLDRVAILLANGFAARGLTAELWLTRDRGPVRDLICTKAVVRTIPAPRTGRGMAMALQVPALRTQVRTTRPKILLSAGNQSNLAVALACRGTSTAAIAKITNPIVRPGTRGVGPTSRRLRFGLTARLSRLTLALSAADARRYGSWYPGADIAAVHNPYVTDAMLAIGRTHRAPGAVPALLSLGRLTRQKDHATLLDAVARLRDRPWRLTIVGDGPLGGALKAQAAALGIADRVTFEGFTSDPLGYLAQADLLVLSSRWEGLPAAPIEAMACGCAVVATDCAPGLTELLAAAQMPAPTPPRDAAALARAIAAELDRPAAPGRLVAAAQPYTLDASIDDHLRLMAPFLEQSAAAKFG